VNRSPDGLPTAVVGADSTGPSVWPSRWSRAAAGINGHNLFPLGVPYAGATCRHGGCVLGPETCSTTCGRSPSCGRGKP